MALAVSERAAAMRLGRTGELPGVPVKSDRTVCFKFKLGSHMARAVMPALHWPMYAAVAIVLLGCREVDRRADQCASSYPRPTAEQLAADTTSIPTLEELSVYRPGESLPQIFSADSSIGRFRNLFFARFGSFRSQQEVRSFIGRFDARIVGKADLDDGWYAVLIPDPGPDTSTFNLLLLCIGANHRVFVRSVFSRQPIPLGEASANVLP